MSNVTDLIAELERRLSKIESTQKEPYALGTSTSFVALRTFTPGTSATDRTLATLIVDLKRKGTLR